MKRHDLTKADIVELVYEKVGLPHKEAAGFVETFLEAMKEVLIDGESLKVSGFGTFNVRKKKERIGRNPKTKEEKTITARRVVTFKASEQLNTAVQHSANH